MDYEGKNETATDHAMGEAALGAAGSDLMGMAQASSSIANAALIPDANNTVVLPDGATLDDISVRGRDLIIVLDDGRTFIIPDGAVYVPQIVSQGVAVPPLNLAALLIGNEPEPAAGAVRSSGGNFEVPVDPIQDAYNLGNLLPYTELAFPEVKDRQLFPIIDRKPITGPNADILLDDDALAGGNAGGTGDDADAVNITGTLAGSGGDGALTWTLSTAGAPAGFSYVANGTGINVFQGATLVLQVTLNTATGAYTVTQVAPIQHDAGSNENNAPFTLGYTVTDIDGDSATGTVNINVDDDSPVAANDTDTVAAGTYGPETGNVLTGAGTTSGATGADRIGADGPAASGAVTAVTGTAGGTIGGATAGQYGTLTLNANGTYSYVRNAGTPGGVADTFTYTTTDRDGDTTTATLTINIADALPLTGENATVRLDDDALAGGNPGGTGDDTDAANTTGTLSASGGDGPLAWALSTSGAPAGFTYVANGTGLNVFQGTTLVMQVTLNTATGAYTVTQVAPIQHAAGGDENDQAFTFNYTVTDVDGDTAPGTLSVSVDDDTPVAANDTDTLASGTYGPETGNVLDGTGTTSGAAGTDSIGADGAAAGGAVTAVTGSASGAIGGTTAGTYGTLTLNADGSYSYVRNAGTPGGVSDVFTYTITDRDGDTTTATLTIAIEDARPVTAANGAVQLDDDALAGGNPGGTGDDPDAVNVSGFLAGSGGDGPLTWQAVSFTSPIGFTPTLVNPGLIEVRQGANLVFTITIDNATGAYTVTQVAPIDHSALGDENNTGFSFGYRVIDQDGDQASGSIAINIDDDTPVVSNDTDSVAAGTYGPETGNVLTGLDTTSGAAGADSLGADGAAAGGAVTAITGTAAGTIGGSTAGIYGVLTMNADGSYSYVRNAGTPGGVSDVFSYTVTDGDGDTATATLTITIEDARPITGGNATVLLDDDALAGGNPGGTGDDVDSDNATGFLAGSGGDGPLTWQAVSFTSPIGFTPTLVNPGLIEVRQGATLVFTIAFDTATGAYTVTQVAPIDHSALGNENNTGFSFGYRVIDQDGDQASGSIAINIDDDTPVVSNDTDSVASGTYGPETGNVLTGLGTTSGAAGADSLGADGAAAGGAVTAITGTAAGTIGGSTAGTYGVLTMNADGSYSYVRNAGTPGGVSDTFTYTITDGDGDTATATLTIDIADALPLTGQNLVILLDDDALAGGNAGGTGDDADTANTTGTLSASGGDGPLSWALDTSGAPAGFSYVANGTGIDVFQGATLVMQVTLNSATGAYTITQVAPIVHDAGSDENNQAFTLNYTVTDQDGDTAPGTFSISVDDDTPLAANDTDTVASGTYDPEAGNVLTGAGTTSGAAGADSIGADGAAASGAVTAVTGGTIGGSTAGTYGVLTLNADGSYSYVRNAGTPGGVSDVFTYTITDADGDSTTATLTIAIEDARPVTAPNALVQLDDDALGGGNPGGTGDDPDAVNVTGTLTGSGGDGPLTWQAVSFTSPVGFVPTLVNPGLIEVRQGATLVFTITMNTATGAYTVTQVAPIDHTALGDENNTGFSFGYRVIDQDGDFANGSIAINIDDDTPVVSNDTDSLLAGATGPATGNVLTDADAGDAGDSDTGADSLGADGGSVTGITGFGGAGTIGGTTTGQYGTLTLNADGSYSYTRSGTAPLNATDTFTYTVTDGDGDTATATLIITIEDAGPVTGQNLTVLLDDDAQAGGNPGGTGDDVDSANATGFLAGSGGDGALTWTAVSFSSPGGFSATLVNPGLVEVYQGTTLVMTIAIDNATGAYTVTQVAPIDHTAGLDENNAAFTFGYRVTDADGDQAFGTIGINIDDDTPVVANDTDALLGGAMGPAVGNVLTGVGSDGNPAGADSIGADGPATPGAVTVVASVNVPANTDNALDSSNNLVVVGEYGTLTLNADGSYSYTRNSGAAVNAVDTFTYTVTDADGDTATATLTITIGDSAPVTGPNATVLLDDDALAGGNPGGTGDDVDSANATGFLAGSGGDGALTWTAVSFSSPGGFSATLVNPGLVEVYQGTTLVMTIAIDNATGAYTVTQVAPIDHTAGLDENNSSFTFGYRVDDADGDQAFGTIGINIDDDTPVVSNDTDSLLAGATGPATGNVLTDADAGDAGDSDTGADSLGADGGSVTGISGSGGAGTIGGSTVGTHGTLTMNADGSYSYTRNGSAPLNATDTFTYTVTDGDGDTATATLIITIEDAGPITGQNLTVLLDDEALAGGNPGGVDDDIDNANAAGFLAGSGGDGALTWTATSLSSPAGFSATLVNPGLVEVRQGTTLVMTIAIDNATGAYTVAQVAPIDHTALLDENNSSFTFGYRVDDADGDQAFGSLSINIDDDTPVVSNDTDSLLAGATGPATGNVLTDADAGDAGDSDTGADSLGADGGSVTGITGAGGAGTIGGSTIGTHGTLTMNADGSYSYTRSGTAPLNATDTFTYTVTDGDGDTATATLTITIADAGPVTGANVTVLLDDDALAGGNPGGTGDDVDSANVAGFLAGSGGDGALTWTATSLSSPAGFSASLVNPGLVEVRQGTTLVFTIAISNATGAYTVTQVAPIDHAALGDENNASFTFGYRVDDADGDPAFGSLSINIDDDTPVVSNDTDSLLAGATGPATGNVLTGVGSDGNPAGADSLGADGGSVTGFTGFGGAGTIGGTATGQYGTLTLNADGSYSYTRSTSSPLSATDTFTYTVTDGDGDTATATLTITIADAGPVTGANVTVLLDDEALAGGNPGGTGDDVNSANATGFLTGSGGDGALTWTATSLSSPAGFSASLVNPGLVEVRQGTTLVFTIAINNATGAYTVTQVAPIDHAAGLDENNAAFTFGYRVDDADGDPAFGSLSINFDDDTPVVSNDTDSLLAGATGPATGNVLTDASAGDAGDSDNGADSLGADGGSVTAVASVNVPANVDTTIDGSNNLVVSGQYGTLTLNTDGSYSYLRSTSTPLNATDAFTYTVTDGDGDTATATLTITIADAGPVTGANLAVQLDDDALAGGNPGGISDDPNAVNVTGSLAASGGDGPLAWSLANSGAPAGFSYVANGTGISVFQGANLVMQVTLNTATGAYVVSQVAPIVHAAGSNENNQAFSLSYTVTDQDGDSASGTLAINVDDDTPSANASATQPTLVVDDTSLATNATASFAGVFTPAFGADGAAASGSVTYALGVVAGPSGLIDVTTGEAVNLVLNGAAVEGRSATTNQLVFTLNVAANGVVTLDQIRAVRHDNPADPDETGASAAVLTADNLVTLTATVTDRDGDTATATANIGSNFQFRDDGPTAVSDVKATTLVDQDINAAFVLDFSGSINNDELSEMLNAVKDAGYELFANNTGAVSIRVVLFASDAQSYAPVSSFTDFVTLIDSFNSQLGGTRPISSSTDYTAAIQELMSVYVPSGTANNQVFFLSDGNPNEQTGTGALLNATATAWNNFVDSNGINVTAIGVGNGINTGPLQDVDVDGTGVPILAENFDDLIATLIAAVQPPISSNVLTNDVLGADGGRVNFITINGITYTWNGATTITASSGPSIPAGTTMTVPTSLGGQMFFNFATGAWTYTPPQNYTGTSDEVFQYGVVDGDGDTSQATLTIDVASVTGGSNFARNEYVITNQGSTTVIPEGVLLANDSAGTTITGIASSNGAASVVLGAGNVTFTDTGTSGGSFVYNAASGANSDTAFVAVNNTQAGEATLDGTGASEVLLGRDGGTADTLNGNAGSDRLFGLGGNDTLVGGTGADRMSGGAGADTFTISSGHTALTKSGTGDNGVIAGFDVITDFVVGTDILNLNGTPTAAANTAGTNGNDSTLTVGGSTIKSHAISNGIITFDDANTFGSALTLTTSNHLAAAIEYLRANDLGSSNVTVAFTVGGSTYVFQQVAGSNSPTGTSDILVQLEGVTIANLTTLIGTTVTPIALDLDGDGAEFLALTAGVTFDYAGDGSPENTAWVGSDDGILAIDHNGDGFVNDGSEIVFGGNGQTDLEGLRARYDSNHDDVLDASDAAFSQFGVWQDANSDGVAQAGEFRSLTDMGITSISLTSDGVAYAAANGDVQVAGEANYTLADGTTGTVADASFALSGEQRAARSAELVAASSVAAAGLLAAMAMEHANASADVGLPRASIASTLATDSTLSDLMPVETQGKSGDPSDLIQEPLAKAMAEPTHALDHTETAAMREGIGELTDRLSDLHDVAGNDDARSALFGNDQAPSGIEAVLAQDSTSGAGANTVVHPAVVAALADGAGAEAVDSIVDHFAPNSAGAMEVAGNDNDFDLQGLLNMNINGGGDSYMPHFSLMVELDHDSVSALT